MRPANVFLIMELSNSRAIVVVNYEEGDLTYTISYNEDMEMVGFLIK